MKQIIINIDQDGEAKVEAMGFQGKGCAEATKAIEQAIGSVDKQTKKPEFDRVNTISQAI